MLTLTAVTVAMITAIFNIPMDNLFSILTAPTADDLEVQDQTVHRLMSGAGRRISAIASGTRSAVRRVSVALGNAVVAVKRRAVGSIARRNPFLATSTQEQALRSASALKKLNEELAVKRVEQKALMAEHAHLDLTDDTKKSLLQLSSDIVAQRGFLDGVEMCEFDRQWNTGWDETGEHLMNFDYKRIRHFAKEVVSDKDRLSHAAVSPWLTPTEVMVLGEMETVDSLAKAQVTKLKDATDTHIGMEILHTFICDLLGRDSYAAKIFLSKAEEDFSRTYVVRREIKVAVIVLIVLLNAFFVYFALLRSFQRGAAFQHKYLIACGIQICVEILLFETVECVCVNYFIPSLITNQMQEVVQVVETSLDGLLRLPDGRDEDKANSVKLSRYCILDAPTYLFISTKVAQAYPSLLESVFVTSYHSYLPGNVSKKWLSVPQTSYNEFLTREGWEERPTTWTLSSLWMTSRWLFIFAVLNIALRLGALPSSVQRIVIHLLQPLLLAGLTVFFYEVFFSRYQWVGVCGAAALLGGAIYLAGRALTRRKQSTVAMVTPSTPMKGPTDEFIVVPSQSVVEPKPSAVLLPISSASSSESSESHSIGLEWMEDISSMSYTSQKGKSAPSSSHVVREGAYPSNHAVSKLELELQDDLWHWDQMHRVEESFPEHSVSSIKNPSEYSEDAPSQSQDDNMSYDSYNASMDSISSVEYHAEES